MLCPLIEKIWRFYRAYGFINFIRQIYHRRRFVVFLKPTSETSHVNRSFDVVYRTAIKEDSVWGSTLHSRYLGCRAPADLSERILSGELVVVGMNAAVPDEVIYISVVSRNNSLFNLLPDNMVENNDSCSQGIWVPAPFRKKKIAERGLRFAESMAHRKGVGRLWAFVKPDNYGSIILHQRAGYVRYAELKVGRFIGKRVAAIRVPGVRRWSRIKI